MSASNNNYDAQVSLKKDDSHFNTFRRIKVKPDEKIILEVDEGFIVNAESTYGYSVGDRELIITCDPERRIY